jgi:hypothetical protein
MQMVEKNAIKIFEKTSVASRIFVPPVMYPMSILPTGRAF